MNIFMHREIKEMVNRKANLHSVLNSIYKIQFKHYDPPSHSKYLIMSFLIQLKDFQDIEYIIFTQV